MNYHRIIITVLLTVSAVDPSFGQTDEYYRFSWEMEFRRHLKDKWALETTVSSQRTSKPNESKLFEFYSRFGLEFWAIYYLSPKWQLSGQLAYFDNQRVPELGQEQSNEFRISQQGIYFIRKIRFNLASRTRLETRLEQDDDRNYNPVFHLRQRIQITYPLNGRVIREGIFYGIASEELAFKSNDDVKGKEFFDNNTFRIGLGFAISDNLRAEFVYINSIAPRSSVTQYNQTFQLRLSLNNFLPHLMESLKKNIKPVEGNGG